MNSQFGPLNGSSKSAKFLVEAKSSISPQKNGRIVCGCFTLEHNPEAPNIIIAGSGPIIEHEADLFCRQNSLVPIFIKRRPNEWEYVGAYKAVRYSNDPAEIAAHHNGLIIPLNEVTRVIFLQRAAMS
jgi:hypothetical protein